jgi:hypothetical protein
MTDKPKQAALLTFAELSEIVDFCKAHSTVNDLTLEQLLELRFVMRPYRDMNSWIVEQPGAEAEFHRILAGEPHRRGLKLEIVRDEAAGDSRDDRENLGTLVCWHKRYSLGDVKKPSEDPEDYRAGLPEGTIVLNVFLLDHSGLSMRTNAFECRWDSGQVGYIYATPERIAECFGAYETMTDELRAKVVSALEAEVKTYDDYLTGNVWGFRLKNGDGEDLDSCWGFYGDDKDGIACHLPDDAKALLDAAWENRS